MIFILYKYFVKDYVSVCREMFIVYKIFEKFYKFLLFWSFFEIEKYNICYLIGYE